MVALSKTEAIAFGGRGWKTQAGVFMMVDGERVHVMPHIKYLGIILDPRWNFGEHFRQLAPQLVRTASALSRLLPNIGGPGATCRRLYAGVTRSMALYGLPIWADRLTRANRALLRRPQRVVAIRICKAYHCGVGGNLRSGPKGVVLGKEEEGGDAGISGSGWCKLGCECSKWSDERATLMTALEIGNLSLQSVVAAMLCCKRKWEVVVSFCEYVISQNTITLSCAPTASLGSLPDPGMERAASNLLVTYYSKIPGTEAPGSLRASW
ncbi:uncharacterized protein LOC132902260 [Amyelois transitella]|uniref:uncharacterized protein LOC132902260 n=1 Tax=Amyelois transitella TaxID=680683 RepID=UPI00298F982F|nr:uncharacterized protein LOC132902260 [Amyelois transitella]